MQTIKTFKNGGTLNFDCETGEFSYFLNNETLKCNRYAHVQNLKETIGDVYYPYYIELNFKHNIPLTDAEGDLTRQLIDNYRDEQRKLHAAKNEKYRNLNLLLSEGHDDGRYNISLDDDNMSAGA